MTRNVSKLFLELDIKSARDRNLQALKSFYKDESIPREKPEGTEERGNTQSASLST